MILFLLIITGTIVGVLSTFFGVGGGTIALPMLYEFFPHLPPQSIIGTSLGMIFINSILNVYNFRKAGRIPELKFCILLMLFMMAGAIIGKEIVGQLSPQKIKLILGVVLSIVAIRTFFSSPPTKSESDKNWKPSLETLSLIKVSVMALVAGIIITLTGLGGAAVLIPFFLLSLKMPFNWIPVYSNVGMSAGSLAGLLSLMSAPKPILELGWMNNFQIGYVNWALVGFLVSGVVISSKYGVKLSGSIDPAKAKRLFAALLTLISIKIFWSLS